jgi:pyridinium-3,5-biscarboxylic acid mononucleotide synthase
LNSGDLEQILKLVREQRLTVEEAAAQVRKLTFHDLGFANVDHHRAHRCGSPEVIFCQGKTPEQVGEISKSILTSGSNLLATRATVQHYEAVGAIFPDADYHEKARAITLRRCNMPKPEGVIMIVSAGTSDIPVAEEARVTAEMMDSEVRTLYDVGVAGIHRLLARHDELQRANVLIVVAGMEGALASVVGGLVARPVVAVPTSVGYGASFGGIAPLLTMLNSCAAGVTVVNIDNGFGAGYVAALINRSAPGGETGTPKKARRAS